MNNGDNTWQLVEGDLSQETINIVGDKIEAFYCSEDLSKPVSPTPDQSGQSDDPDSEEI
ncbi:MAG TPA: hypothetical protein VGB63_15825 [Pedobacter sp.]